MKVKAALGALLLASSGVAVLTPATAAPTCFGQPATIVGTSGNDEGTKEIIGTSGADVIVGLAGRDSIRGRGGNDLICGNGGDDALFGERGNDRMAGQVGGDFAAGGPGADRHLGGDGSDQLDLAPFGATSDFGSDYGNGGGGNDFLSAVDNTGNDSLFGGAGSGDDCEADSGDAVSGDCEF